MRLSHTLVLVGIGLVLGPDAWTAEAAVSPPIVGERPGRDSAAPWRHPFDVLERRFQQDLIEGGERDEILALLSAGTFGSNGNIVIRTRSGMARLVYIPDRARTYERPMTAQELGELRAFLGENKSFDLGALKTNIADGIEYEMVRLKKTGGRRLYMNNPEVVGANAYVEIVKRFRALLDKPGLELHYNAEQKNADFHVVVSDPHWAVLGVRMDQSKLLLQVVQRDRRWGPDVKMPDLYQVKAAMPQTATEDPAWVTWPSALPVTRERLAALSLFRIAIPKGMHLPEWLNRTGWASESGGVRYIVGEVKGQEGLWRLTPSGRLDLVVTGKMSAPVVAADGKSLLLVRTDLKSWGHSGYFARIDLSSKQVHRIDIDSANDLLPLLPTKEGVLVERARADPRYLPPNWTFQGPDAPEHFLVDTATGAVKKVAGEFEPLPRQLVNPLQPAAQGGVWAVKTDWQQEKSVIGRYDLKRFSFTPVRELSGLALGTNDVWVDEQAGRVYGVYDGDLVTFSLKP